MIRQLHFIDQVIEITINYRLYMDKSTRIKHVRDGLESNDILHMNQYNDSQK